MVILEMMMIMIHVVTMKMMIHLMTKGSATTEKYLDDDNNGEDGQRAIGNHVT